jgi:hypothetical protein
VLRRNSPDLEYVLVFACTRRLIMNRPRECPPQVKSQVRMHKLERWPPTGLACMALM